jgi:hypothetical protein
MIGPPHAADNVKKLGRIIEALQNGIKIPPLVILPCGRAITGSHRWEAYTTLGLAISALIVSEQDYTALKEAFWEQAKTPSFDGQFHKFTFNPCKTLIQITEDERLKAALKDQDNHFATCTYKIEDLEHDVHELYLEIFGSETVPPYSELRSL